MWFTADDDTRTMRRSTYPDRPIAASFPSASGLSLVSFEKLGYLLEQTPERVTVTLTPRKSSDDSDNGDDTLLTIESCEFSEHSVKLRVRQRQTTFFFDVAHLYAPCDPAASRTRLPRKGRRRVLLDIAKAEKGNEWPRLRA